VARRVVEGEHAQDVPVSTATKLAPSDFAFLWDECKRCFYLKVARGIDRPRTPMPSIFTAIDSQMKAFYAGKRTEEISSALPPGKNAFSGKWVESAPIERPDRATTAFVRGPFDTVLAFDDGSYAVVDFKTSSQKPENVAKYARQLHAYAYALEHPAPSRGFALAPVRALGLLVYEPAAFDARPDADAHLRGSVRWLPIEKDEDAFLRFLDDVLATLDAPEPPPASDACAWCGFRARTRTHAY
jgi:hypothetical protein